MNKSAIVALKNRYPKAKVDSTDNSVRVWDESGELRVALNKDGNGDWRDVSAELGATDEFSLAPIAREHRAFKLYPDGKIGPSEEYEVRFPAALKAAQANGGRVPHIGEAPVIQSAAAPAKAAASKEAK